MIVCECIVWFYDFVWESGLVYVFFYVCSSCLIVFLGVFDSVYVIDVEFVECCEGFLGFIYLFGFEVYVLWFLVLIGLIDELILLIMVCEFEWESWNLFE